mmetsp:Transcript_6624/g.19049  ORF Transcript_6624/g.19049 Transcript_6624/m.19049 type:complete len:715 (-) Transcript_6624:1172-3316(-)
MDNSNHVFMDQLRAWNRCWSSSVYNYDGSTCGKNIDTAAGGTHTNTDSVPKHDSAATEEDKREHHDETIRLTPLEKARLALSRLPTKNKGSEGKQGRNNEDDTVLDSIVPCLFSVLQTNNCDSADSTRDVAPSASLPQLLLDRTRSICDIERGNTYELRQIEWHVVLVLELLACAVSSNAEGEPTGQQAFVPRWSKSIVLKALVASIGLYRENQMQRRISQRDIKKSKKSKKSKKKKRIWTDPQPLSEKEKEELVLIHLVQILSRAPFVLPRHVPLSEFLISRCFTRERRFWERLSSIVSQIFESFEIPNPYRPKPEDDLGTSGGTLFSSSNIDTNRDTKQYEAPPSLPGGKTVAKSAVNHASLDKKRKLKRERLQELAKTKKRQRLASLTSSKKKHRGSHFHRNLDDISKLLDKKKNAAVITNNDALAKLKNRKTRDRKTETNVIRLSSEKSKTNRQDPTPTTGGSNKRLAISRTEQGYAKQATREPNASRDRNGGIIPLVNRKGISLERRNSKSENDNIKLKINSNNRKKEGISRTKSKSRSISADSFPTTPQRSLRFDATAVVGETPVPNTPNIQQQPENTVVERPVPGLRSRIEVGGTPVSNLRSRNVVGETPPPGSGASDSPMSSSSSDRHSFSPPPLPSTFVATSSAKDAVAPSKQPVRLFGLLKRASCIDHSGGKLPSGAPKPDMSKGQRDLASIDKARAYLRRKST